MEHLRRRSTDELVGLRFQFRCTEAVVKDVCPGFAIVWSAGMHRAGLWKHAVRPGDVVDFVNDRPFDKQALEHELTQVR